MRERNYMHPALKGWDGKGDPVLMKLRILKATITEYAWYPQADKPTCAILAVEATLTKKLATDLGKPWVFEDNGVARHLDGSIGFAKTFSGGSVELGDRSFPISRAWKFKVKQAADGEDIILNLQCRLQFTEGHLELLGWALEQGSETFGIILAPAQEGLFDEEDESEEEAEEPAGPSLAPAAVVRGNRGKRARAQEMVVRDPEGEVILRGEAAESHPAAEVQ